MIYDDGKLSMILIDSGYIDNLDSSPTYNYYVKDHLGNNREVVRSDGTLWQVTDYYPFGTPYDVSFNVQYPSTQPYRYNGKELTGSSLFLYGMSWGIRNGILKAKTYRPICDRAWQALRNDCVHADGFLGFTQGTGKEPSAGQPVTYTSVPDFEDYGLGCFLLGSTEYYKLTSESK